MKVKIMNNKGQMTIEEAIEKLKRADITVGCKVKTKTAEAIEMAIKVLEREPCEDAISRQTMLNGLASIAKAKAKSDAQKSLIGRVMFFTESLPPVTPQEPRKGHWIYQTSDDYLGELNRYYECSECGRTVGDTVGDIYTEYPYCHCGAKMIKDGEK